MTISKLEKRGEGKDSLDDLKTGLLSSKNQSWRKRKSDRVTVKVVKVLTKVTGVGEEGGKSIGMTELTRLIQKTKVTKVM